MMWPTDKAHRYYTCTQSVIVSYRFHFLICFHNNLMLSEKEKVKNFGLCAPTLMRTRLPSTYHGVP
jgi:hypothetical protein